MDPKYRAEKKGAKSKILARGAKIATSPFPTILCAPVAIAIRFSVEPQRKILLRGAGPANLQLASFAPRAAKTL